MLHQFLLYRQEQMPLTRAVDKATDLFKKCPIVGFDDFSVSIELGFSLTVMIVSKGKIVTFKLLDESSDSLYPNGILMQATYVLTMDVCGSVRPYQDSLTLNTFDTLRLPSLSTAELELAYTKSALSSEVLSLIFKKMKSLNK